ncbi:MAG: DUF4166 domain-containing protein [Pseudomonadota bacterium]
MNYRYEIQAEAGSGLALLASLPAPICGTANSADDGDLLEKRMKAPRCAACPRAGRCRRPKEPAATGPYQRLLGAPAWRKLPVEVRNRFAGAVQGAKPKHYTGHVIETRMNRVGRIFARFAQLIGAPLPAAPGGQGPASVLVCHDETLGGQLWTRTYAAAGGFPQVVNSVKRFQGPTGLEEYVGPWRRCGLGMALRVSAPDGVLTFRSTHYFLEIFSLRLRLPAALTPGTLTITHEQLAGRAFRFTLALTHARLGALIRQTATFLDPPAGG